MMQKQRDMILENGDFVEVYKNQNIYPILKDKKNIGYLNVTPKKKYRATTNLKKTKLFKSPYDAVQFLVNEVI